MPSRDGSLLWKGTLKEGLFCDDPQLHYGIKLPASQKGPTCLASLVPLCLGHGQRQRRPWVSGSAEASNSPALKGLVSVEGQGQIQGHQGLAALSTRPGSTPDALLQRYNLAHCAAHARLALVDSGGSFPRYSVALGQSCCRGVANFLAAAHPDNWPLRLERRISCVTIHQVMQNRTTRGRIADLPCGDRCGYG